MDWMGFLGAFIDLNKVVWLPSPVEVAKITAAVYMLKRLLALPIFKGALDKLTHGVGTLVLVTIVTVLSELLPMVGDGLTLGEVIRVLLSGGSAVALWEMLKFFFPFLRRKEA